MTSYGDPHAGPDYDDGRYQQNAGRAQVPQQDGYAYSDDDAYYGNSNGNGYQGQNGYQEQASYESHGGFVNQYPDQGYAPDPGYGEQNYADPGYGDAGYAEVGYADPAYAPPATGRASVPTGRASVPAISSSRPGALLAPPPPSAGRASVRPPGLEGESEGERRPKKSTKRKRAKWQKWVIAGVAVFVLLAGGGLIGGTYFYDQVLPPGTQTLKNSTEVLAADGSLLAKLGSENRSEIAMAKLPDQVKRALFAGEDKSFYEHDGIDLWGIGRAAWNNLTGGETQGASTITQQYARQAAQDLDVTYARKLREAVMARKLEDKYTKEEILGFYLNTVYFGRGAHGIGAAAEAYFKIPADKIETMTVSQAALLGAVLKQPEGKNGFDPHFNLDNSKDRWNYVLANMIEMKWLTEQERAGLKYPEPANPEAPVPGELQKYEEANAGGATGYTDKATGYVVNYVADELDALGIVKMLKDKGLGNWKNAGLRITTTIHPVAQGALERQLNRDIPESTVAKQRPNIVGAGVSIEPKTGRVLAYYGGSNNGSKTDWAGSDVPHPPASSFKIYTLAAAIDSNYSIHSMWDPTAMKKGVDGAQFDLSNANREGELSCDKYCTLEEMTIKSYNVPFFQIAQKVSPKKIVEMAQKAGVRTMWGTNPFKAYELGKDKIDVTDPFFYHVGFGQYPITVLDHATGTATMANHGIYNKPHFVLKVEQKDRKTGQWTRLSQGDEKLAGEQTIKATVADEVTSVLKKIAPKLSNGTDAAGKTGTWENGLKKEDGKTSVYKDTNAHVWFTGYTNELATAIWFGSNDENKTPIKEAGSTELLKAKNMGSGFPKDVWKKFMDDFNKSGGIKSSRLTNGSGGAIGSKDIGTGKSPTPAAPPNNCMFPGTPLCPSQGPGNGGPGNGGPGNGGGGGGLPIPIQTPEPALPPD